MKEKNKAFTLIELVVTIAIVAILFVTATPLFTQFQQTSRLNSAVQMLETTLGEAFSSAHSRPECFVVESNENIAKFTMKSYERQDCENLPIGQEKTSRNFTFSSGVTVSPVFKIKFKPPFGDMEFLTEANAEADAEAEKLEIVLSNNAGENKILLMVYRNSGLVTRIANQGGDGL